MTQKVSLSNTATPHLTRANQEKLCQYAQSMRAKAYAPYSGYLVGAALLTKDNQMIGGCNVESASYGATICAERTALVSALAQGHQAFSAIAVATATGGTPCGICRQMIVELCGDIPIYICDEQTLRATYTSTELLPKSFSQNCL